MNAPAPQTRWPKWKIILAYAILGAVAVASIWSIDQHVLKIADEQAVPRASRP